MKKSSVKLNGHRPNGKKISPPRIEARDRDPRPKNWLKIYEAADRADFRGMFYFPTLVPSDQQDQWTRHVLQERVDYLYKNVGAVSMVIDGLALEEVGTGLWPKWITSNAAFNKVVTDDFHYVNHDPRVFSADANTNYYSAQFNIRRMIRLYGDCFGQLLRPPPGAVNPSLNLIPGYRIDGGEAGKFTSDGVQTNELGRALNYNLTRRNSYQSGVDALPDLPVAAADMLHFHDAFLPGQRRGVSCLASVAKRLFRREDVLYAISNGTLLRERVGYAIESPADGGQIRLPEGGDSEEVANADGTKYTVQKVYGDDVRQETEIPEFTDGRKIKLIESNRPGTEVTNFLDSILREVCWATLYPPEYVLFLAGMGLGANSRLILQKARGLISSRREFQLIPQFANRWNVYWLWQRIKAGIYDKVPGGVPSDWWRHKILSDADKSVDIGREGKLIDDRFATGRMAPGEYFALAGTDRSDVDEETRAMVLDRVRILNEMNADPEVVKAGKAFSYEEIWPRTSSMQLPQQLLEPVQVDNPV